MASDEFRVEKRKVRVRLRDVQGKLKEGFFLCDPVSPKDGRPETLLELLNGPAHFLPFIDADGGPTLLISKEQIALLELIPGGGAMTLEEQGEFGNPVEAEFILADGHQVRARLLISGPAGHGRALDYLNDAKKFIQVIGSECELLINLHLLEAVNDRP